MERFEGACTICQRLAGLFVVFTTPARPFSEVKAVSPEQIAFQSDLEIRGYVRARAALRTPTVSNRLRVDGHSHQRLWTRTRASMQSKGAEP